MAQDAGGTLAMTEDEKKRLNELLNEEDKVEKDIQIEYDEKSQSYNQIVDYNPLEVKLAAGDGFQPIPVDQQRINEINSRLESRNYMRLLTGNTRNTSTRSVSTINGSTSSIDMDPETFRAVLVSVA